MLAPVREHVLRHHPARDDELEQVCRRYATLSLVHGPEISGAKGDQAMARLTPELPNIVFAVRRGLAGDKVQRWIKEKRKPQPARQAL